MSEHGCAYQVVAVCKAWRCGRKGTCPAGFPLYRDRNGGGHHHANHLRKDEE